MPRYHTIQPSDRLAEMIDEIVEVGGYPRATAAIEEAIRRYYGDILKLKKPVKKGATIKEPLTAEQWIAEQEGGGELIEENGKKYRQYLEGALEVKEILPDNYQ